MPAGETRESSAEADAPAESVKSPASKTVRGGRQPKTTTTVASSSARSTPGGASTYVSPYKASGRGGATSTTPGSSSKVPPGRNLAFKDIVNRFNETPDEKISLPSNATPASRLSNARKPAQTYRTAGMKKTKESPKLRQGRIPPISQDKPPASRASSSASTTGDAKPSRPSTGKTSRTATSASAKPKPGTAVIEGDHTIHPSQRRPRTKSTTESDLLSVKLGPGTTLRHRRSRSNIEVSTSSDKPNGTETLNGRRPSLSLPSISAASSESIDALSSPTSTSSKPLTTNKKPMGNPGKRPANTTTTTYPRPSTAKEPVSKRTTTLSAAKVSPHSSRHTPQPSKSPTLQAVVTIPPPAKSPPLRSSRPRAQLSTPSNAHKQRLARIQTGSVPSKVDSGLGNRASSKNKKKIPEIGSVDFAARRATIQAAFTKTVNENVKGAQPEVVRGVSVYSQTGDIENDDIQDAVLSPSTYSNKELRTPIEGPIVEERESDEDDLLVLPDKPSHTEESPTLTLDTYNVSEVSNNLNDHPDILREGNNEHLLHGHGHGQEIQPTSVNPITFNPLDYIQTPTTPLPQYNEEMEARNDSVAHAMANHTEKQNSSSLQDIYDDSPGVSQKVEMVERPHPNKRFSLSGLPALQTQVDVNRNLSTEDVPISPFTRSLLSLGDGQKSKPKPVSVIITPNSPVENRQPPSRLMDISKFLRPESAITEWTDTEGGSTSQGVDHQYSSADEDSGREQRAAMEIASEKDMAMRAQQAFDAYEASRSAALDHEPHTPDEGGTILSILDRYDEPREDFLTPYIDTPSTIYTATVNGSEQGDDEESDEEGDEDDDDDEDDLHGTGYRHERVLYEGDDQYEGDEDEHSSCSTETAQSSARPSVEGSDDWSDMQSHSRHLTPEIPATPRQLFEDESAIPPTPPPKDAHYLPPLPRKNSVPFAELTYKVPAATTKTIPKQTLLRHPLTLPEIQTDSEPLGLAIRMVSPTVAAVLSEVDAHHDVQSQISSGRPSLEHSQSAPVKTPYSATSSFYSEDGSRRNSSFTSSFKSNPTIDTTPPTSITAVLRPVNPTGQDTVYDQKALTKRKNIMKELVDTEKSFFQDMTVTEEIYKGTAMSCSALSSDDVKTMFGNTDLIVQFSKTFLESLKGAVASVYVMKKSRSALNSSSVSLANSVSGDENRNSVVSDLSFLSDEDKDRKTRIGEVFVEHLQRMEKVYGDYCKNHEAAVMRLQKAEANEAVKFWLRECKHVADDLTNAWSLESLLIKPVQRMLKYPLMLHGILECTPKDHPDYKNLVWAEQEIRLAADRINELKKRKDIVEKIIKKQNAADTKRGIAKLISQRAEVLRQTVGPSEAVVDTTYNKLVETFHTQYVHLQLVFRDYDGYVSTTDKFMTQFTEMSAAMKEYVDGPQTRYYELVIKWKKFDAEMKELHKNAFALHSQGVRKHCVDPILTLLRLYDNSQRLMAKRNKKSVDFAKYTAMKEKGAVPDKKTKEQAEAYQALNDSMIDELPKLFGYTRKLVQLTLDSFVELQSQWYQTFMGAIAQWMPEIQMPVGPEELIGEFSERNSYVEGIIKELALCNGKTVMTLKAMASPFGSVLSPSSTVSLEEHSPSPPAQQTVHRPNTAEAARGQDRGRTMSFSNPNKSVPNIDTRRHSGEVGLAAAMGIMATVVPGASHAMGQQVRSRASSAAYPARISPGAPVSPSLMRPMSSTSPTRSYARPGPSSTRPASATSAAFSSVPEVSTAREYSRTSSPSPQVYSGAFSSAMPMSDDEASPAPTRPQSRQSSQRSDSRRRTMTVASDAAPLFLAVSLYEFNIDKQRREAGFPYLTYVQGEVFDVIGIKGEIWLAKNQDDAQGEIGWIWCKHFHKLSPD